MRITFSENQSRVQSNPAYRRWKRTNEPEEVYEEQCAICGKELLDDEEELCSKCYKEEVI